MPSDTSSHYGRLSDGKTAASRDCQVRLDLTALSINSEDGSVRMRWPYGTLRSGEPIRPHSIDVLVSSKEAQGLTLFVPGAPFAAQLAQRAPQLTATSQRWRHARPWIIAAAVIVGLTALIHSADWTPTRTIAGLLPESWRDRLGDAALASMSENRNRCTTPSGIAALEKMIGRLSAGAGPGQSFKVIVVDWDLLNAFAVPGNKILLTKELVEKANSPEEVAGVLAHEMGHGIALHPETGIIRAVGLAAALELMMGGSSGTLANMGLFLAQLGYTRSAEREADETALKLLREARISQQGLQGFFRRMLKDEGGDGNDKKPAEPEQEMTSKRLSQALDILSTHPPTRERVDLIRNSQTYPATPALTPSDWAALRSICAITEPIMEPETGKLSTP